VKYRVRITATAKLEAEIAFNWIQEQSPTHAVNWFNGLVDAIERLSMFPARWPLAIEDAYFAEEIRQMLYGKIPHVYRVLFTIRNNMVYVLHIRHGTRQGLEKDELIFPDET